MPITRADHPSQERWRDLASADVLADTGSEAIDVDDVAWRQRLDADAYAVLRKHGTEHPGSSPLNEEKREGIFVCAGYIHQGHLHWVGTVDELHKSDDSILLDFVKANEYQIGRRNERSISNPSSY